MQSKIIEESELVNLKVSSLPTRPTAASAFGGRGYTASEMKAAFDKFPEYLLEKLNLLIEDLLREGDESYVGSYKTTIDGKNLRQLIATITGGEFANYIRVGDMTLAYAIISFQKDIKMLKERLGILT